jgi:hypothetical protein
VNDPDAPAACRLERGARVAQRDRYRLVGRHLAAVERSPQLLDARFTSDVDEALLEETLAIERECCSFFSISYEPGERRLVVTVEDPDQDPALDALTAALGA